MLNNLGPGNVVPLRIVRGGNDGGGLKGPGGSDTSGGMEERIARLEAHMEHVRADVAKLSTVPEKLAGIEERLRHLPTKVEMWGAGFAIIASCMTILKALQALSILH